MSIHYEMLAIKKSNQFDTFGTPTKIVVEVVDIYSMTIDQYEGQVLSVKDIP